MGLVSEIAKSAKIAVRHSGPTELIAAVDLPAFLDAVRAKQTYAILGLEGFRVVNDRLVPDMDAIADFSSLAATSGCDATLTEALSFVSAVGNSDLFYDIVVEQTSNG